MTGATGLFAREIEPRVLKERKTVSLKQKEERNFFFQKGGSPSTSPKLRLGLNSGSIRRAIQPRISPAGSSGGVIHIINSAVWQRPHF